MGSSLIFIYLDGHRDVHCFLSVFERRNYSISLGCPFGSGPIDCHLSELVQTVTAASRFTTVSALCITPIRVVTLWLREGDIFCAGWSQSTALRVCVCVCVIDRSSSTDRSPGLWLFTEVELTKTCSCLWEDWWSIVDLSHPVSYWKQKRHLPVINVAFFYRVIYLWRLRKMYAHWSKIPSLKPHASSVATQ